MATALPQSVAFEIDLNKKADSPKTALQQRLEHSPRREVSLEDLESKQREAEERRARLEAEAAASIATHNAKVRLAHESAKAEAADKLKQLQDTSQKRLASADAKREGHRDSWMKKLGQKLADSTRKAESKQQEDEWAAKDLAAKIEIQTLTADLRRQEAKLKVQEALAASNHDKLARGKLALDLTASEAEKIENRSERKLAAAEERRDLQLKAIEVARDTAAGRAAKIAEARRLEEKAAAEQKAAIEAKLLAAEERKDAAVAGKVEQLASRLDDKAARAAEARKQEERAAAKQRAAIEAKILAAEERKDVALAGKVEQLASSARKKQLLVMDKQKGEEDAARSAQKDIHAKLQSASARKDDLLEGRVKQVQMDLSRKQNSAKKAWLSSLSSEKKLKNESERKLMAAAQRKEKLLKDKITEVQSANRQRIDQIESMQKSKEKADVLRLGALEQKIASASEKRDKILESKSTSKKRQLSPRAYSPRSNEDIEARIQAANARREEFLATKVEKAQSKSSPRNLNKTLFSAVTPNGSGENLSPRMKAARLEEFENSSPVEEKREWDGGNPHQPPGLGMIALGSGIAIVLVGLIRSFWKR